MTKVAKYRDPRLDFFRGLSLFIILVSHTRGDALGDWIPARYGLSDAANLFVFVSGYAGGIAFGGIYRRRGWLMGTARIGLRLWQLYIAQLCVVMVVAALPKLADLVLGTADDHVSLLALNHLFAAPGDAFLGLITLTYVPHYLDILPVYIVILAMVPVAIALARIHHWLVPVASVTLWGAANLFGWNLPTEATEPRGWFFDPFCWQLLFFTGFSIRMGWGRPPPASVPLFSLAAAYLAFGVAVTRPVIFQTVPGLAAVQSWVVDHADKRMVDPLQYLHFIASAYVVVVLLQGRLALLQTRLARPIVRCGQQALSVFIAGIILADLGGLAFDRLGTDLSSQIMVNLITFAITFAVAYGVAWIKSAPWNKEAVPVAAQPSHAGNIEARVA